MDNRAQRTWPIRRRTMSAMLSGSQERCKGMCNQAISGQRPEDVEFGESSGEVVAMRLPKWLVCAGCLFVCAACRADVIDYDFNGSYCSPFGGCYPEIFEFQISSTAVPEISVMDGVFGLPFFDFGADQVRYVSRIPFGSGDVLFAGNAFVFGATIGPDYYIPGVTFGPDSSAPLYSGSVTRPTLLTGDFGPANGRVANADDTYGGTLVVTDFRAPVATPEPSSLLLLGTGACALFGLGRRRWMQCPPDRG